MTKQLHASHKTRFSDAGSFDEICINCGRTDTPYSWGKLAEPCPSPDGNGEWDNSNNPPILGVKA